MEISNDIQSEQLSKSVKDLQASSSMPVSFKESDVYESLDAVDQRDSIMSNDMLGE